MFGKARQLLCVAAWMMGCGHDPGAGAPDLAQGAAPDAATAPDMAYTPTAAANCPVTTLDVLYPGALPPNPYGPAPAATTCIAQEHDVIVVLGCPSNADGTASTCQ